MRTIRWATVLMGLLMLGVNPAQAEQSTGNAIVSEGNGAAVFIGFGGDRQVDLSWRPGKQYEDSVMLYQVQRSDGPMLESKSRATSFTDRNLQPNSSYTYNLTVFQAVTKKVTVKGVKTQKTSLQRVGANSITVVTLPTMVVNVKAACSSLTALRIWWEKPQNAALNQIAYSVVFAGNVVVSGLSPETLEYTIEDLNLRPYKSKDISVVAENSTGPAKTNAGITAPLALAGSGYPASTVTKCSI